MYTTLTGRHFDLSRLSDDERAFLRQIALLFQQQPPWDEFSRAWLALGRETLWREGAIPVGHPVYRICQDLAARRGIAEGRLARPDYRDQLSSLIEERFESRYRFCKETGIDPAHLSRVLAGKKHFAAETLFKIVEALGVELALVDPLQQPDQVSPALEALSGEGPAGSAEATISRPSSRSASIRSAS